MKDPFERKKFDKKLKDLFTRSTTYEDKEFEP